MILRVREDQRKERVGPKVGKDRVCIFVVWQDEMNMRCCLSSLGSPEYILRVAHSNSVTPVSLYTHCCSLTIHLESMVDRVWRCTGMPWLSKFRDALGGWDGVIWEMHLEAVIDQVWRCTGRLWPSDFGDALAGYDRARLEEYLEAVEGRLDGSWDSIHWLTCNCGNVESWVQHPPRDVKLAGSGSLSIMGWCCTWCMLYSVLSHDYGMER